MQYKFQGITLTLDHNDPETPAMVTAKRGHETFASTWDAAVNTGYLMGSGEDLDLTPAQMEWLGSDANCERVDRAFEAARGGHPDYN